MRLLAIFGLSLLFAPPVFAAKFTVAPELGQTEFVAIGKPAMLRIKGDAKGPQGEIELLEQKVTGTLKLPLEKLETGISMRDEHMKTKYLETAKFPDAELTLTEMTLPPSGGGKDVPFKGQLNLHGVKNPVEGTADIEKTDVGFKIKSHFNVILSDYKIDIPTYAGLKVADKVEVNVGFEVKK